MIESAISVGGHVVDLLMPCDLDANAEVGDLMALNPLRLCE